MDINTVRGIITLIVMLTFIGVWAWAWSSKRKQDFKDAANLPFSDDVAGTTTKKEGDQQ